MWWLGSLLDSWGARLRAPYHDEFVPQKSLGAVFEGGGVVFPRVPRREARTRVRRAVLRNLSGTDRIIGLIVNGEILRDLPGLPVTPNGGDVVLTDARP